MPLNNPNHSHYRIYTRNGDDSPWELIAVEEHGYDAITLMNACRYGVTGRDYVAIYIWVSGDSFGVESCWAAASIERAVLQRSPHPYVLMGNNPDLLEMVHGTTGVRP